MRFFLLPIFAALTVVGTASRDASTATSRLPPIVVFVHGRGLLGQDTAALRREWKRDLDSSLALAGMPRLRDQDVRLAWYADVLDPDSDSLCTMTAVNDGDSLSFGDLARGLLGFLASAVPKDESVEMRGLISDLLYAVDASKRCAAERRVGSVIEAAVSENRPVVIVAYSLGSLVTYGYLHSRPSNAKALHGLRLVTIGSPLGVAAVRQMVFGENVNTLPIPRGVSAWENIYDPNDFISGPVEGVLLGGAVKDRALHAAPLEEAHLISRYLQDRVTGAAVMRALCAGTPRNEAAPACAVN
jgi:hypothetical protein